MHYTHGVCTHLPHVLAEQEVGVVGINMADNELVRNCSHLYRMNRCHHNHTKAESECVSNKVTLHVLR